MTVWENAASLENVVFQTVHAKFLDRRAEWFEVMADIQFGIWWVPNGHKPTLDEALGKLPHLQEIGDSIAAFGWTYLRANRDAPLA